MNSSMLSVRKFLRSKIRSCFGKEGEHDRDNIMNSSKVRTVINEEYREAFRTKSYTEICEKIQRQLETRIILDDEKTYSPSSSASTTPSSSEYLVEPRHETLVSSKYHHHFVANYFDISLEAGRICEFLLRKIHQVRIDHNTVIQLVECKSNCVYKKLASFSLHSNPFSDMTPQKFHDTHKHLLYELKLKCGKTKKKKRFLKRGLAVVGCGAIGVTFLLFALHSAVGVVAVPGLILSFLVLSVMKKLKREKREKEKVEDAAAKGIYVLIKDFDMMSRLVGRLGDEMEDRKLKAEFCVKKEVAREFKMHEFGFLEELEELEKQIYLCFLHINRSRRLLIQELDN